MISSPMRGARAAPTETTGALGFDSLFGLLAWGGALLLLLLAPSQLAGFWPGDYNFWPQALFLLLLAGVGILLGIARLPKPKWDGVAACLALFLGWSLLSVFTSTYAHDAWLELARVTGALAFFWLIRAFPRRAQRVGLAAAATLGVAYLGGGALWNFIETRDPRQFGGFFNPNLFANALALALPLALGLPLALWSVTPNRGAAIVGALPFVVLLPALAVTSSKGGLVAALVGLAVAVAMLRAARPAAFGLALRKMLPALVLVALVFGALAAKTVGPRLLQARGSDDNSTMFRVYLWRGTRAMIAARPIVGWGPGAFAGSYARFATAGPSKSAHQSWLQIAAESGVPALLLLAAAFAFALGNGWKFRRDEGWATRAGAMGALAAMLIHGCFDAGWGATPALILLALALGLLDDPRAQAVEPGGNLNFGWLGATVLLGVAGYGTQAAASAQDALVQSQSLAAQGASARALEVAGQAVALDAGSSRAQANLGVLQSASGAAGEAALDRAIALQPDRAANYFTRARLAAAQERPDLYEKWMALALSREPKSSYFLLSRARYRLAHKDARGYDDLETLMQLWDAPYGRFPALGELPNFDFARGAALLAPHLMQSGQSARARKLIEHALRDVAAARIAAPRAREIAQAVGSASSLDTYDDLDAVEARLQSAVRSTETGAVGAAR